MDSTSTREALALIAREGSFCGDYVHSVFDVVCVPLVEFLGYSNYTPSFYYTLVNTTVVQLYYQSYVGYSSLRTVVRLLPMFISGVLCNVVMAFIVGRVSIVYLAGE